MNLKLNKTKVVLSLFVIIPAYVLYIFLGDPIGCGQRRAAGNYLPPWCDLYDLSIFVVFLSPVIFYSISSIIEKYRRK